jgi:hypothetical protein
LIRTVVRSQSELAQQIADEMNDSAHNRWTEEQIYRGMNSALRLQSERVWIPRMERWPDDGFGTTEAEYELPDYMDGPINPMIDRRAGTSLLPHVERYEPIRVYDVYTNELGVRVIQLGFDFDSRDGRIVFWFNNGPVPTTLVTLDSTLITTADDIVIAESPVVPKAGFVKIDDEWIGYAGIDYDGGLTLHNLQRGAYNTTTAEHTDGTTVEWGIAAHRNDVYQHLAWETMIYLHQLYMNRASTQERQHHFDQVRYYKQIADEKWSKIISSRPPLVTRVRHGMFYMAPSYEQYGKIRR